MITEIFKLQLRPFQVKRLKCTVDMQHVKSRLTDDDDWEYLCSPITSYKKGLSGSTMMQQSCLYLPMSKIIFHPFSSLFCALKHVKDSDTNGD